MAIAGADRALMQARSGLARSGATRSGYYLFRVVVTIDVDGAPVDVSAHVAYNGWSITQNLNDDVDTATLRFLPSLPLVPEVRSQIRIGFGSAGNLQFAGVVLTLQRTRRPGPDPRFWYDVTCVDWLTVFDAHLVVADYPSQSATVTILDLVTRFTRGGFSTAGVAPNLPVVANMAIVNERPSTVLRRLTNKIGGGFYLDAARTVRAWSATVASPLQETAPQPLTDELATLKTFQMVEDGSQQRTRLFVEGQRTALRLGVPDFTPGEGEVGLPIPVEDSHVLAEWDETTAPERLTRVGTQIGVAPLVYRPASNDAVNVPGTTVTADAAPGDASMAVADATIFPSPGGWAQVGGQVIRVAPFSPTVLDLVDTPGEYGALKAPVTAGSQIIVLPWVQFVPRDRRATDPIFVDRPMRRQADETPVVLVIQKDDATTAAAIAIREGSDGYHEHLVQDGRYNAAGAGARAEAELLDFAAPLVSYTWETEDLHAAPGRMQTIALAAGTPVAAEVRITNVEIAPVTATSPPRRQVRATKVRTAGVLDIWVDEER